MGKKIREKIRDFGLFINGRRNKEGELKLNINPFSGRVIGRAFLTPQDSLLFEENTPTEEITSPTQF